MFQSLFLLSLVFVHSAPPVYIDVWTEAKCPDCERTIRGTITPVFDLPGIWDIVSLTQTPWGNAYCETKACPSGTPGVYDPDVRVCWDSKCNATGSPPDDCFSCIEDTSQTCQHGHDECIGNTIIACVINSTSSQKDWWGFTSCFEGLHNGNLSTAPTCAKEAGFNWEAITKCSQGEAGKRLDLRNARKTTLRPHPGTPTIWINGEQPKYFPTSSNQFLKIICEAYTGTKPSVCSSKLNVSEFAQS